MANPLMPKATAVWLVENTALSFEQIADFCGMHMLEIQGIADGEVATGMRGVDPIANGQLTREEVKQCEENADARLKMSDTARQYISSKNKSGRYTPVSRRQDKPDAIAWLIKFYPNLPDNQIIKLIGTTKTTIAAVRDRTHRNQQTIKPRDPVLLGLCSQMNLETAVANYKPVIDEAGTA